MTRDVVEIALNTFFFSLNNKIHVVVVLEKDTQMTALIQLLCHKFTRYKHAYNISVILLFYCLTVGFLIFQFYCLHSGPKV